MPFAELLRTDDPRNSWDKTRRMELVKHARSNNITEINIAGKMVFVGDAPAILIRKELSARGLKPPKLPPRTLGTSSNVVGMEPNAAVSADAATAPVGQVDAADDLARQFAAAPPPPAVPVAEMMIGQLRKEAKRLGLKGSPRDTKISLLAKIAEHGKNAA